MKFWLGVATLCTILIILLILKTQHLRNWLSDLSLPIRHGIHRARNIMVPMRDGIQLATDVYTPLSGHSPYPVILIRTTYGATDFQEIKYFVKNGYVVVVQDVRGRYRSQGQRQYSPHRYSRSDGYDTMDWIVKQKWSSGKIGTYGCSYLGESQIILAAAKHPNHICMIAQGAGGAIGNIKGSYGYFGVYENGVLNLASALGWFTEYGAIDYNITAIPENYQNTIAKEIDGLPVIDLAKRIVPYKTSFEDYVSHGLTDIWWKDENYINDKDSFTTAALHVNTWYDQTVHDTFRLAEQMAEKAQHPRAKHQYVLIDPGNHCSTGKLSDGRACIGEMEIEYKKLDFMKIYLDWFNYWLKDVQGFLPPHFQYFLINAGSWKAAEKWPPPETEVHRYYLRERGLLVRGESAASNTRDLKGSWDSFDYDPLNPMPTVGGSVCCTGSGVEVSGAFDQSRLIQRKDILIYASDPLKADLDLVGNAKASLYVSTSAMDTDFTLKIVDQQPDGKAYNLQDSVVRLSYRNGVETPQLVTPGEIYKIEMVFRPIAYRFKSGHRVAIYISSSNFPRLARNLNTGENSNKGVAAKIATNTIHRNCTHPSYIELPISGKEFSEATNKEGLSR